MDGPSTGDTTRAPLRGATVLADRYRLVGLLGSGGMGTVYRARDLELDEIVALKVLKKEIAQLSGMLERFRREVKLARKVTHRNVARMFDIGEHQGDRFLTMELVEGEPLSAQIGRERPSVQRTLAIAGDILDGLAASHDAGVIHGDLKPENVICAKSDRCVITDFGIARALTVDPTGEHTTSGVVLGTPAYMAPEQIEGVSDLDGRVDLYALGCMLYRLLTGTVPWKGVTYVSVAAARLTREPPDPREVVPDLSSGVPELVLRLMARDRNQRFADARAAKEAITKLLAASPDEPGTTRVLPAKAPAASPKSAVKTVAVLRLAGDRTDDDSYLAAGLTDDLTDALSMSAQLRVRPRGVVLAQDIEGRDERDVGRALGVDVVVAGSLRRTGDNVRMVLRLVTVIDGFQLWAKRFDAPTSAILEIADEAASEIADILATDGGTSGRRHPSDPLALELYLRGRFIYTRRYFEVAQAVALFRAAHERAPEDGRIASALALATIRHQMVAALPQSTIDEARRLAEAARAADPNIAEAHVALALTHLGDGELRATAHALLRALEVSPNNADARNWLGFLLAETGREREAIPHLEVAKSSDSAAVATLTRIHVLHGDWDAADALLDELEKSEPRAAWIGRSRFEVWRNDPAHAEALLARLADVSLPELAKARVETFLLVAAKRELVPRARELITSEPMKIPRLRALLTQVKIEILCATNLTAEALPLYAELESTKFIDLTWLDLCPLLEPLRSTPEHAALRSSTAARARAFTDVVDAFR